MSTVLTIDIPGEFDGFTLNNAEYSATTPRYYVGVLGSDYYVFDINTSTFSQIPNGSDTIDTVNSAFEYNDQLFTVGELQKSPINTVFFYNATTHTRLNSLSASGQLIDSNVDGITLIWDRSSLSAINSPTKNYLIVDIPHNIITSKTITNNSGVFTGYKVEFDISLSGTKALANLLQISTSNTFYGVYDFNTGTLTLLSQGIYVDDLLNWVIWGVTADKHYAFGTFDTNEGDSKFARWDLNTGELQEIILGGDWIVNEQFDFSTVNNDGTYVTVDVYNSSSEFKESVIVNLTNMDSPITTSLSQFYTEFLPAGFTEGDISVTMGFRSNYYFVYYSTGNKLIAINPSDDTMDNSEPIIGNWPRHIFLRKRLLGYL